MPDGLVEEVARAMLKHAFPDAAWHTFTVRVQSDYTTMARAALAAIEASGYRITPRISMKMETEPAEVFPLAEFLADEMQARGWTTTDVAIRMGGDARTVSINLLVVNLLMCIHSDELLITDKEFKGLARAFDISEEYFRNLDAVWRKWPAKRSPFTPPESLFDAVSRRSLIHVVR